MRERALAPHLRTRGDRIRRHTAWPPSGLACYWPSPMKAAVTRKAFSILVFGVAAACASQQPEPARAPQSATEIDLARPERERPSWPPGLVPCAKDAPEGVGCAVKSPSESAGPANAGAAKAEADKVWNVPVGPDDPVRGPADALVTLVVFADFECPFCKRGTATLERLLSELPHDVRLVWKDLPLPMHAGRARRGARPLRPRYPWRRRFLEGPRPTVYCTGHPGRCSFPSDSRPARLAVGAGTSRDS